MKANKKQRRAIKWAVLVFLLATLFPPWLYVYDQNGSAGAHARKPAGYYCMLTPPSPQGTGVAYGVSLDTSRLMLEWVCILVTTGAAWFFLNVDSGPDSAALSDAPPSQRKPFWPTSMKQWLFIAGIGVLAAGSTAITVVKLNETPRKFTPPPLNSLRETPRKFTPPPLNSLRELTFDDLIPTVDQLRTDADKGQPEAQHSLGWHYLNADGVIRDYVEAVKWYRKAAEQGYAPAQCSLGFCYGNGFGVPKDFVQAYFWSNLAAAQGRKKAIQNLAIYEKEMRPEQIAEAQRLSREFIPYPTPRFDPTKPFQVVGAPPLTNNPTPRKGLSDAEIGLDTPSLTNIPTPHR
jgi:hypothetical protein